MSDVNRQLSLLAKYATTQTVQPWPRRLWNWLRKAVR